MLFDQFLNGLGNAIEVLWITNDFAIQVHARCPLNTHVFAQGQIVVNRFGVGFAVECFLEFFQVETELLGVFFQCVAFEGTLVFKQKVMIFKEFSLGSGSQGSLGGQVRFLVERQGKMTEHNPDFVFVLLLGAS